MLCIPSFLLHQLSKDLQNYLHSAKKAWWSLTICKKGAIFVKKTISFPKNRNTLLLPCNHKWYLNWSSDSKIAILAFANLVSKAGENQNMKVILFRWFWIISVGNQNADSKWQTRFLHGHVISMVLVRWQGELDWMGFTYCDSIAARSCHLDTARMLHLPKAVGAPPTEHTQKII